MEAQAHRQPRETPVTPTISARDACRTALARHAERDPRIICLDSDMGGLDRFFGDGLAKQYIDVGIAEAAMVTVAAGMARGGCKPVAHTMATFAVTRACEQLKLDVAHHDLPVVIVATHAGFSAGHYGPSHFCLEDFAILRSFPNMVVLAPCDAFEAEAALAAALAWPHPVYIRLGRKATPHLHQECPVFEIGKASLLQPGSDATIIAAGPSAVRRSLEAAESLRGAASVRVVNMSTIKPIDSATIIDAAFQTRAIVTVEEHMTSGGLGSAVAEIVSSHAPCRVERMGVDGALPAIVGDEDTLLDHCGITPEKIRTVIRRLIAEAGGESKGGGFGRG